MEPQTIASAAFAPVANLATSLDALARCDHRELTVLFSRGQRAELAEISGHPRGRMLAVPRLEFPPVATFLRWYAASRLIIWEGKSFVAEPGATQGTGYNRVRFFGRRRAFSFRTLSTTSLVDGAPCIAISYDLPENPRMARGTYDELRCVGPGLFLGRGMRRRAAGEPDLLLWFALDTRQQDSEPR